MRLIIKLGIFFLLGFFLLSCTKERYRTDKKNRLSKHTKKASDYLANQSIELTQENIENKESNSRKARRRLEKQQKELNEANEKTSKVKRPKKHPGDFKFY